MAYSKENFLKKVLDVQAFYIEQSAKGYTNRHIVKDLNKKGYYMSERTLYNYLGIPAKRDLKELESKKQG